MKRLLYLLPLFALLAVPTNAQTFSASSPPPGSSITLHLHPLAAEFYGGGRLLLVDAESLPPAKAQSTPPPHSVSLSWNASSDAAANPTLAYNVYRMSAACPTSGTTGFVKLSASPVSGTTFTDTTVPLGQVCYYVTATLNGAESVPSNTASGVVLPGAPTLLKITSSQ